jgi:uncharacterized phage protein gp47/JayE
VTYTARRYDEIVRDMLTTLTGGTVRESVVVPPDTAPLLKLREHPVRRISHAEGQVSITLLKPDPLNPTKKIPQQELRPYRFTDAEFELVATTGNESDKDAIRFRDKGQKPVPGSTLTINYYPVQTDPVPLTDVTVGSVVRTLLETVGFELALSYQQLEQVYKSAFVETAEGDSLDRVVALVGITRLAGGHPVAKLRFTRRAGTSGAVSIPARTKVTDEKGNRYLTTADALLEPGESTREVMAAGESASTQEVGANELKFLEIAIAGISEVTNPDAARRLAAAETDKELRARARGALRGTVRGTVDAIRYGLLAIAGVKDVAVDEPRTEPGVIDVRIAYSDDSESVKTLVAERIEQLRPAGIVVRTGEAAKLRVAVKLTLTLQGASLPAADVKAAGEGAASRVEDVLKAIAPGGTVRRAQLVTAVLSDPRIVDATIVLTPQGEAPVEQLSVPAGKILEVIKPVTIDTPLFEQATDAQATVATVTALLPIHLVGATTAAEAAAAIVSAFTTYLNTRGIDAALTVDGLLAAIRDETRYAVVRPEVLVTIESQGTFRQLTDGVGSYTPAAHERLEKDELQIDVREGTV